MLILRISTFKIIIALQEIGKNEKKTKDDELNKVKDNLKKKFDEEYKSKTKPIFHRKLEEKKDNFEKTAQKSIEEYIKNNSGPCVIL